MLTILQADVLEKKFNVSNLLLISSHTHTLNFWWFLQLFLTCEQITFFLVNRHDYITMCWKHAKKHYSEDPRSYASQTKEPTWISNGCEALLGFFYEMRTQRFWFSIFTWLPHCTLMHAYIRHLRIV